MYSEQDFARAEVNFKKYLVAGLAVVGVGATATIVTLVFRMRYVMNVIAVLTACVSYGFITIKVMPHIRYRRFLNEMRNGMSRETDGWFVSFSDEPRMMDGIAVHDVIIRIGSEEEDERLFLWDDDKPFPAVRTDDAIHIVSYGNHIKSFEVDR